MKTRSYVLAFCCFLGAAAFAIAYLGIRETYVLFATGQPAEATVVAVRSGSQRPGVQVAYRDRGREVRAWAEECSPRELSLSAGQLVTIRKHRNVPSRIMLQTSLPDQAPSPWLLVCLAGSLALTGYCGARPALARRRRLRRTSPIDIIVDSLARTRVANLWLGFGLGGFGAFIAVISVQQHDEVGVAGLVVLGLLAVCCLGLGVMGLRVAFGLIPLGRSWVLRVLERQPAELAWFYKSITRTEGVAASVMTTIELRFADGRHHSLQVENDDADPLIAELARRAPHAQVGYDAELERLYHERPDRFRPAAHPVPSAG
jgi:hypothetical protein